MTQTGFIAAMAAGKSVLTLNMSFVLSATRRALGSARRWRLGEGRQEMLKPVLTLTLNHEY